MAAARPGKHTRAPGRHAVREPRRRPQAVSVVLIGVTAGSFALVGLLPSTAPAVQAMPIAMAPTVPSTPARPSTPERASRTRSLPVPSASASPSPLPTPSPSPPVILDVLPGCTVEASAATRFANGRIPSSALCALPGRPGHQLRADAARAFVRLDAAYRAAFGDRLCVTDSYRSLAGQQALARQKPDLAARPGRSEHGVGVAVDLACGAESFGTRQHRWLQTNAEAYGWYQPSWARRGGARPEPWHWELRG